MPSNLSAKARKRYFGSTVGRLTSNRSSTITDLIAPTLHVAGPPWGGFTPDLALGLMTFSDAIDCTDIISKSGVLQPDDGFEMVDIARLPLGGPVMAGAPNLTFANANPDTILRSAGNWVTDGFAVADVIQVERGTGTYTVGNRGTFTIASFSTTSTTNDTIVLDAGDSLAAESVSGGHSVTGVTPPATSGQESPVTGLFQYTARDASFRRFAITGGATRGHLWELVGSVWTNRSIRESVVSGTANNNGTTGHGNPGITGDGTNPEKDLVDWTYYPNGDFIVFTNFLDPVHRFPDIGPSGVGAGSLNQYEAFNQQDVDVADASQGNASAGRGGLVGSGSSLVFRSRTCETFAERLVFFNNLEGTTSHPTRIRWTDINVEPSLDPAQVGAGFLDIDDTEAHGLKLLQLGDVLAAYMDQGTAILRRTRNVAQALTLQSVTEGRGVLSTQSVVDLGSGVHFGLFTDGWFFYDATGRWVEAGVRDIRGKLNHKFKETFLDGEQGLNWDNRDRVVVTLDRSNRFIRISFPSGATGAAGASITPNRVWIYDVQQDSVWPMSYGDIQPNIYANIADAATTTTYDTIVGSGRPETYDAASTTPPIDSYASFGFRTGRSRPVFGTTNGRVFRHSAEFTHREQLTSTANASVFSEPSFKYEAPELDFGIPSSLKRTDKLHVSFERLADGAPAMQVELHSGEDSLTRSLIQSVPVRSGSSAVGKIITNFATSRVAGNRVGFTVTGTAPAKIHSFQLDYFNFGVQGTRS